ncbi:MAG TPA: hypothetical protein VKZ93_01660 [Arenibacter sp.]|nr:hypothetical protein [Arenibacter sp.]
MNYKIKSLLYLVVFIAMSLVYNQLSEDTDSEKKALAIDNIDNTETDTEVITATDYQY